ncbi:carbohydrate-binding module family 5 protein [Coniophora puteana RWD-64-598 SS2]|uniref:Carbohydrate-binding module family 5 protein n=1 Tax=Coniophora puteana (strain RWD-64-598) TaxID=741705 RepID=A0A5M3MZW7_CONPW|nr:carbohydrate-binding module family 5 protein [Coniophora puteana RWD-64-598 SS2]EIW84682.1 carbohydrate-binding module family 5 protein [Coniophora puteana RWD-64-598 SS2]
MFFNSATIALALTLASVARGATIAVRGGGDCNGILGWQRNQAYSRGDEISYWGSIWQAKEWSYNNPPGDAANQWNNVGSCNGANNGNNGGGGSGGGQNWNKARGDDGNDTQGVNNDNSVTNNNDGGINNANGWNNGGNDIWGKDKDGGDSNNHNGNNNWDQNKDSGSNCDCSNAQPWSKSAQYPGGSFVTYNGHLWIANWWVTSNCPGDTSGSWTDKGACSKW